MVSFELAGGQTEEVVDAIADRYNGQLTLVAEIKAGKCVVGYELTSK
ncbi:MAG: hypothetical protein ABFD16_22635 [Thermoguttaceae bacterium]